VHSVRARHPAIAVVQVDAIVLTRLLVEAQHAAMRLALLIQRRPLLGSFHRNRMLAYGLDSPSKHRSRSAIGGAACCDPSSSAGSIENHCQL
jgi:hypothetical protein